MKKLIPIILFIGIFITASCGASPQKSYAADMAPTIDLLTQSQEDYAKLESLLTDPTTTSANVARLDLIDLYNMAAQNKISREDYLNLGLIRLDDLISPAAKLSKDGQAVLDILLRVTPVEETKSDHEVLQKCVQARVAFAEELSSALKDLRPIEMSKAADLSNCGTFDASLEALTTYVNKYK